MSMLKPRNSRRTIGCDALLAALLLAMAAGCTGGEDAHAATDTPEKPSALLVGSAYADITPDRPMRNYKGGTHEPSKDACPLRVQVIVCNDGRTKVALVSVDCTFLGRTEVLRIRDALRWRIGVDPDHVCVAATHSHAAPATTASFLHGDLPDPRYIDLLVERTCGAAEAAVSRMRPARLAADTIAAPPIGVCRRRISPQGQVYMISSAPERSYQAENPIDQTMSYIVFEDPAGKPLAAVFTFACHNNMVGGVFSGDMFGRAGEALRERLGDVATVSLAAPCGDVGYRDASGKRTMADDRAAGRAIAEAILNSYAACPRREGRSMIVRSVVKRIPDRPYDPAEFTYDNGRGSSDGAIEFHKRRYGPEEIAVRERGQTYCDVEIQAISFGSVALVTNPAELFSVYGVRIREASPFEVTLVSSLSNGYCGYVPTPESFKHRGYETYRTVYTSRLAKDGGERICKESVDLLRAIRSQ